MDKNSIIIELDLARKTAKQAGKLLLSKKNTINIETFVSDRDTKLLADIESENLIKTHLSESKFPILAEESGKSLDNLGSRYWVVDPLDGTVNYSRNIPICAVSIALLENSKPILGVIYDFENDHMYEGSIYTNAKKNNSEIHVSNINQKNRAILLTGMPNKSNFSDDNLSEFIDDFQTWKKVRMIGSAAIASIYVASGKADLYKESNTYLWDIGLRNALGKKELVSNVPTILGSNKDEVKLWLGTADYFVNLEYSVVGEILNIPRVVLENKDAFEAFNYYRSAAWQIRGVLDPAKKLLIAGNNNLYLYRYDWDDHRKLLIADFKELFGAAHATEIPLITGDDQLVGRFGYFIYPKGPSKRFTSKNMMLFWKNFAYSDKPGSSSNGKKWMPYNQNQTEKFNLMLIDNKKNLRMISDNNEFIKLINELNIDTRLNKIEKCVVFYQMTTFVGDDIFDSLIKYYNGICKKSDAQAFLKENDSFIDF